MNCTHQSKDTYWLDGSKNKIQLCATYRIPFSALKTHIASKWKVGRLYSTHENKKKAGVATLKQNRLQA